ncbi:hypothetical protein TcG_03543 [Trypanosoma cruzi]|nr:hypothetical protein TcG_03543 [Trypanosoma cruzi]
MRGGCRWTLLLLLFLFLVSTVASAQVPGDALSTVKVDIGFNGKWTAAFVAAAEFSDAVQSDVSAALGIQRAAAWFDAAPAVAADPGTVAVSFVVWSDPGIVANFLLRDAEWTATKAYYTKATTESVATPFVAHAFRVEAITVRFTGDGWGDTSALPEAKLSEGIITNVKAVKDVTGTPAYLDAVLIGTVNRTSGATFRLEVVSAGIQNVTTLLSPASTYATLLEYYKHQTTLTDGALRDVSRTPASPIQQQYRTQMQMIFGGSWQLVLQSKELQVASTIQLILSGALAFQPSRVIIGNISKTVYPFNLNVSTYVVHSRGFNASTIPNLAAAANYSSLVRLYMTNGGDPSVTPVLLFSDLVASRPPTDTSAVSLVSTHKLVFSGTRWPTVLSSVTADVFKDALAGDLTKLVPYGPTTVNVLGYTVGAKNGFNARVMVDQQGDVQLIPVALNAFFKLAPSLPNTEELYNKHAGAGGHEAIKVVSSLEKQQKSGSACTSRCVGISIMGGCLLFFSIVASIIFCVWRVFSRYVSPPKINSDLVRIPPEKNPFVSTVTLRDVADTAPSFTRNLSSTGAAGPMYPPLTAGVAPFGPMMSTSTASAPESRMTSYVAEQPNSSVVRQGNIIIPSSSGEKEFELIVMPRSEFERNHGSEP